MPVPRRRRFSGVVSSTRRGGTENVPSAVGFAEAAVKADHVGQSEASRMGKLKASLTSEIKKNLPFALFNGHPEYSLPHIINISFDSKRMGIDGEALLFN